MKNFLECNYYDKEYWSEELIIRDMDYDINQYLLPVLWKQLCLKMFSKDLIYWNKKIFSHVLNFIDKWWFWEYYKFI